MFRWTEEGNFAHEFFALLQVADSNHQQSQLRVLTVVAPLAPVGQVTSICGMEL